MSSMRTRSLRDSRPVIVTGMGVVTPVGDDTDSFWKAVLAGRSGLARLPDITHGRYPARLAGVAADFDDSRVPGRLHPQTDRVTRIALAASTEALDDAAIDLSQHDPYDIGVVTGNSFGGFEFTHREIQKLWQQGPSHVSVYESFAWFYAVNTGQISIQHGTQGPGAAIVSEAASGLDAVGQARRMIRTGTPIALTGGVDSALDPWSWAIQVASGRVSHEADPDVAYQPFTTTASGHVPGEGGAIMVMERTDRVAERQSRGYGAITGYAAALDPPTGSCRPPALRRTIAAALQDAHLEPSAVDLVVADAAATPALDRIEADAIAEVFGDRAVPVTLPKSRFGRLFAGGSAVDVCIALLCIRDQVVPAAPRPYEAAPGFRLDVVCGHNRHIPINHVLVLARGHGGFNSAVVVSRLPLDTES